jgi:hypothetical protein
MSKMNLGKSVTRADGLIQTSFDLRDIHFQPGLLVVHTVQGNIVPLPEADFSSFTDAIGNAVKQALADPPVP